MKLYEIDQAIAECLDFETGEILDLEKLEALQVQREKKLEGVALFIKNLTAEIAAIKVEEDALAERRKAKENKAKSMKEWLAYTLNGEQFETAKIRLSFRKSTALEITDEQTLMAYLVREQKADCIEYKAPKIRSSEVTKLIKAGEEIPGAQLVEKQNLQLK